MNDRIKELEWEIQLYKDLIADYDTSAEEKRFAKEQIKDLQSLIEHYQSEGEKTC